MTDLRYAAETLGEFATRLLRGAGLGAERAQVVAEVLLEADLLGQTTHGLDMLARYLDELAAGRMARDGEPVTIRDAPGRALRAGILKSLEPWANRLCVAMPGPLA